MKRVVFVLFTSMLFLTSCTFSLNGIKGDGNVVSQERTASGFYGVAIQGAANVNVQHGADYKVVVTTDNNLQEFVLVEVKNDVVRINTEPKTNLRPTKLIVDVHLPELKSINLSGVGNVKLSDGNASDLKISLSGVGNIDAQNYQVENIVITQSGVGNSKVWATNSLSGTLSGVGNISYKGNPAVTVNVSGVGKVNKQ
jgi:hypothetical protein